MEKSEVRDSLTGLLNRETIGREAGRELESKELGMLLLLDINGLRRINEAYSHLTGDRILREISRIMEYYFFKKDTIGRVGGNEFAVFIPGTVEKTFVYSKMEGLQARIAQARRDMGLGHELEVTIGAALAERGDTFQSLCERAALALSYGKQMRGAGPEKRQTVYFYQSSMKKCEEKPAAAQKQAAQFDDIKHICRELEETGSPGTADFQDYGSFLAVCRYVKNRLERTKGKAQLLLVSMADREGDYVDLGERERLAKPLQESIARSLRSSDIYTQYSCCQFLALIPDADPENLSLVMKRIDEVFHSQVSGQPDVTLVFSFSPLLHKKGRRKKLRKSV